MTNKRAPVFKNSHLSMRTQLKQLKLNGLQASGLIQSPTNYTILYTMTQVIIPSTKIQSHGDLSSSGPKLILSVLYHNNRWF